VGSEGVDRRAIVPGDRVEDHIEVGKFDVHGGDSLSVGIASDRQMLPRFRRCGVWFGGIRRYGLIIAVDWGGLR
jgi:hypothetical protein